MLFFHSNVTQNAGQKGRAENHTYLHEQNFEKTEQDQETD
jgi:hypothetical protein